MGIDTLTAPARGASLPEAPPASSRGLLAHLLAPVDAASLAVFRMMFELLVTVEALRYLLFGWVRKYYLLPEFHFKYLYFEWVRPLSPELMYDVFAAMALAGSFLAVGLFYRAAAVVAFLTITYMFLLEQALYLNHIYLFGLLALMLCTMSPHRVWSLDRLMWRWEGPGTVPAWQLWALRAQMGIVYFYGGIAKLNPDWLRCEPVRTWLQARASLPVVGPLLTQEWMAWFISYGGLLFDLLVIPLLLWRRTRWLALAAAVFFHTSNNFFFSIGIFPFLGIASTLLFLEPDWPRRLLACLPGRAAQRTVSPALALPSAPPVLGRPQGMILALAGVYFVVQLLLPLRHRLYPGDVAWTEEGHRFAWRMKLRDKSARMEVTVRDPDSGREWRLEHGEHLYPWQAAEAAGRPDMLVQYAHYLRQRYMSTEGLRDAEVYVRSRCRLNFHAEQDLVDSKVNLAGVRRRLWPPAEWILPRRSPQQPT